MPIGYSTCVKDQGYKTCSRTTICIFATFIAEILNVIKVQVMMVALTNGGDDGDGVERWW